MLRICIPVHNEATTIGVLLWRLRSVFQGFSREYDVVVYDDASTDGTWEVLEPYQAVMPLTVLRGPVHRGYAASIDALVRHVAADDEYARRDAMVLLQGDFTESPEHLPELVKRFEGGADLVAVHRTMSDATPADERRLRRWGRWAVQPFLRLPPVADPFTGFRLVRISVLRDLLKALGSRPVCAGDGWAANIDFALNVAPFARRIENVEFAPRYDVRQRASRRRGWTDVVALFHWARASRAMSRPVPGSKPTQDAPVRAERGADVLVMPIAAGRTSETAERPDRERGERPGRPDRDRSGRGPRGTETADARTAQPPRESRPTRAERPAREERAPRKERPAREARAPRVEPVAGEAPVARAPRVEPVAGEATVPRPPRQDRPARPRRDERTVNADSAAAAAEAATTDEILEGAETAAAGSGDSASAAGEKRPRKRRRRSRRERGERGTTLPSASDASDHEDSISTANPSERSDESEQDDGAGDGFESETGGTSSSGSGDEPSRRKRRSRRRRRGRRPEGAEADGGDLAPPPPVAEPPAS